MRPEDFHIPDFRKDSGPVYHDRLLFLPKKKYEEEPSAPKVAPISWESIPYFDKARPLVIEYCAGNGQWIAQKAEEHPDKNWIAIERKMDRAKKIWAKIKNNELPNLLCLAAEAWQATDELFINESVDEVFINFPDPWPKKRHHKNRLIQKPFLDGLQRVMKKGAPLIIATDSIEFSEALLVEISQQGGFHSKIEAPFFKTEWPGYGTSYFENLWLQKGRQIRYHIFEKAV